MISEPDQGCLAPGDWNVLTLENSIEIIVECISILNIKITDCSLKNIAVLTTFINPPHMDRVQHFFALAAKTSTLRASMSAFARVVCDVWSSALKI